MLGSIFVSHENSTPSRLIYNKPLSIRVNTQASALQVGNRVTVCSTSNYVIILYMLNSIVIAGFLSIAKECQHG